VIPFSVAIRASIAPTFEVAGTLDADFAIVDPCNIESLQSLDDVAVQLDLSSRFWFAAGITTEFVIIFDSDPASGSSCPKIAFEELTPDSIALRTHFHSLDLTVEGIPIPLESLTSLLSPFLQNVAQEQLPTAMQGALGGINEKLEAVAAAVCSRPKPPSLPPPPTPMPSPPPPPLPPALFEKAVNLVDLMLGRFGTRSLEAAVLGWLKDNEESVDAAFNAGFDALMQSNVSRAGSSSGSTDIDVQGCSVEITYSATDNYVVQTVNPGAIRFLDLAVKTSYPLGGILTYAQTMPEQKYTGDLLLEVAVDDQCTNPSVVKIDGLTSTITVDYNVAYSTIMTMSWFMTTDDNYCPTVTITEYSHGEDQMVITASTFDVTIRQYDHVGFDYVVIGDVFIPLASAGESLESAMENKMLSVYSTLFAKTAPLYQQLITGVMARYCENTCESLCADGGSRALLFAAAPEARSGGRITNRPTAGRITNKPTVGDNNIPDWLNGFVEYEASKTSGRIGRTPILARPTLKDTIKSNVICQCE